MFGMCIRGLSLSRVMFDTINRRLSISLTSERQHVLFHVNTRDNVHTCGIHMIVLCIEREQ